VQFHQKRPTSSLIKQTPEPTNQNTCKTEAMMQELQVTYKSSHPDEPSLTTEESTATTGESRNYSDCDVTSPVKKIKPRSREFFRARKMHTGLITHEMTVSLQENSEEQKNGRPSDRSSFNSAADADILFYARMNGEEIIDSINPHSSRQLNSQVRESDDDIEDSLEDDEVLSEVNSFTGLNMAEEDGYCSCKKSKSKSSLAETHSRDSGFELSDDELSLDEIQRYVIKHMPEDAWRRVSCEPSSAIWKTRMPLKTPEVLVTPHSEDGTAADDDNMSVISDITEANMFLDSSSENQATRQATGKNVQTSCLASNRPSSKTWSRRQYSTSAVVQKLKKRVRFGAVRVRYHQRILDINPAVTSGAAIGLGWRHKREELMSVDKWELKRSEGRSTDILLSRHLRESMLKNLGYTQKDIAQATRVALRIKQQRKTTVDNLGVQSMEEAVEKVSRHIKGLFSFCKKKGLIEKG
jgi:hypothetical protein